MRSTLQVLRRVRSGRRHAAALSTSRPYDVDGLFTTNYFDVPRLPLPEVSSTLTRYLETVRPFADDAAYANTERLCREFESSELSGRLQAELVKLDSSAGYPNSYLEKYWDAMYLELRCPSMVHVNPHYVMADSDPSQGQIERAAGLTSGIARWWTKVVSGALEPDAAGSSPLCMSQYDRVLGCTRYPRPGCDVLQTNTGSRHIAVVCGRRFYRVDVIDGVSGKAYSAEHVAEVLRAVQGEVAAAGPASAAEDVGLLTAGDRGRWATAREVLLHEDGADGCNAKALEALDTSLFVLVLENDAGSADLGERSRVALHGADGGNRWFDKHQVIVSADGCVAMNFEHACTDGMTWNRMLHEVWSDLHATDSGFAPLPLPVDATAAGADLFTALRFDPSASVVASANAPWATNLDFIAEAAVEARETISDVDTVVLNFDERVKRQHSLALAFGRNEIKTWKMSPDGVLQMAFQLAYNSLHGGFGATYEACAMKNWYHGRTETIRSCTSEAVAMVETLSNPASTDDAKRAALQAAVSRHGKIAKGANAAQGPDMGVDRHLYALKQAALRELNMRPEELPDFFHDPVFEASGGGGWLLSTSNVTTPMIAVFGFGPVHPKGYGLGYMTLERTLPINITSFNSDSSTCSSKMGGAIAESLHAFKKLY